MMKTNNCKVWRVYSTPRCLVSPMKMQSAVLNGSGLQNDSIENYEVEDDYENWI